MQMSVMSGISLTSEVGKLNVLFDKICKFTLVYLCLLTVPENSQNIEIEERSLKNIAQKVQLKLVAATDLAANHSVQVEFLLNWLA